MAPVAVADEPGPCRPQLPRAACSEARLPRRRAVAWESSPPSAAATPSAGSRRGCRGPDSPARTGSSWSRFQTLPEWFEAARLGVTEAVPRRRAAASRTRRERSTGRLPCRALTLQHWFEGMDAARGRGAVVAPDGQSSGYLCKDPELRRLVLEGETAIPGTFQGKLSAEAIEALKREATELRRLFDIWTELDDNHSSVLDIEEFVRTSRLARALALTRDGGEAAGKPTLGELERLLVLGTGSSRRSERRHASETPSRCAPLPSPAPLRRSGDLSRLGSRVVGLA